MQPQYVSTITTTSGPPSYEKLEQPPTYGETGNLRVNIPAAVHSTVVKTRIGDDEEEVMGNALIFSVKPSYSWVKFSIRYFCLNGIINVYNSMCVVCRGDFSLTEEL